MLILPSLQSHLVLQMGHRIESLVWLSGEEIWGKLYIAPLHFTLTLSIYIYTSLTGQVVKQIWDFGWGDFQKSNCKYKCKYKCKCNCFLLHL